MTTILSVSGLSVDYRSNGVSTTALTDIDITLGASEVLAIVGESGSGKSTLGLSLIGLLPDAGSFTGGQLTIDGTAYDPRDIARLATLRGGTIGYVPQDPASSLDPVIRIGRQVADAVRLHHRVSRAEADRRAVTLLEQAGFRSAEEYLRRFPHELSGGLAQRVLIALALAGDPRVIIADEPTSALDVTVQKAVLDSLGALVAERGIALILITHDLAITADRSQRMVVMRSGRIVETGSTAAIISNPHNDYTRALIAAAPTRDSVRLTAGPTVLQRAAVAASIAVQATAGSGATDATDATRITDAAPILVVDAVSKSFSSGWLSRNASVAAVDSVSFQLAAGETVALVGESGSGKTTTARMVAALTAPTIGTITYRGENISALTGRAQQQLRRQVQFVYQNPFTSLHPGMTVAQLIAEPLSALGIGDRASQQDRVEFLLDRVSLSTTLTGRLPTELSGGQRQRVAIARALAPGAEILVLDEPTSALDVSVQRQVLQLLVDLQHEFSLTYLFVSHDLGVVREIADRILVMRGGVIVERGSSAEIFESAADPYTRMLLESTPGARLDSSVV